MTEAEDHPPEGFHLIYPDSQFLLRSRSAEALRRLGNAFVRHRISDSELETLTEWAAIAVWSETHIGAEHKTMGGGFVEYSDEKPPSLDKKLLITNRPMPVSCARFWVGKDKVNIRGKI